MDRDKLCAAAPPMTVPAEADRLRGQLPPSPVGDEAGDVAGFIRQALHEVWNWRLLNKVADYYVPEYFCDSASGRQL